MKIQTMLSHQSVESHLIEINKNQHEIKKLICRQKTSEKKIEDICIAIIKEDPSYLEFENILNVTLCKDQENGKGDVMIKYICAQIAQSYIKFFDTSEDLSNSMINHGSNTYFLNSNEVAYDKLLLHALIGDELKSLNNFLIKHGVEVIVKSYNNIAVRLEIQIFI